MGLFPNQSINFMQLCETYICNLDISQMTGVFSLINDLTVFQLNYF